MNEKFTKGPLEAVFPDGSNGFWRVEASGLDDVCTCYGENARHEAHLFAAAPDMYEMLKSLSEMMPMLDEQTHPQIEMDAVKYNIDQLLAKARGEL